MARHRGLIAQAAFAKAKTGIVRKVVGVVALLCMAHAAQAASVSFLAPGYTGATFASFSSFQGSIAFDSAMNLYTENPALAYSGTVQVLAYSPGSGYTSSSVYSTFAAGATQITGLDFSGAGTLYASLINPSLNSGSIWDATTGTLLSTLPDFRPTGIDARNDILFTGRLASNPAFGNVYRLNADASATIVIPGIPLTGIATDAGGDIFVSTFAASGDYLANSIYRFNAADGFATSNRIATFNSGAYVEELTFDSKGILYAVMPETAGGSSVFQISPIPEPETYAMLLAGLCVLGFAARRRKLKEAAAT